MITLPSNSKVLIEDEVPADLRSFFDYTSQIVEKREGRTKRQLTIEKTCPSCKETKRTTVTQIRQALQKGTLKGLCNKCFSRTSRPGPKGENHGNWNGGKRTDPKGYVHLRQPEHPNAQNGYVQEHRLVMEHLLGRLLLPSETVHHKNGIKSDNRIENLELWSKSHSDGCRYDDLSIEQIEDLISHLQQTLAQRRQ